MKPVMYHYVRPKADGLPYFPYLRLADFERQLDHFERHHGFVDREEFLRWRAGGEAPEGVLLTFDDGLRDHAEFVLPVLKARGLFGLFYVSSGPAIAGTVLDVHKMHLAVGRIGPGAVLNWLKANAPEVLEDGNGGAVASTYAHQNADETTKYLKWLFNWRLSAEERRIALDGVFEHAFAGTPPDWRAVYLDAELVRTLSEAGMGVGPHGHTHDLSIRLSPGGQRDEIALSCAFVEQNGGSREWGYCYPYGSRAAFSAETEEFIAESGCPFAFAAEPGDIAAPLAETERYALPRHNCNAFPFGAVTYGSPVEDLSAAS